MCKGRHRALWLVLAVAMGAGILMGCWRVVGHEDLDSRASRGEERGYRQNQGH